MGLVITGFVIGSVWRLKVHWSFKSSIALTAIYWPVIALVWFLIQLWIDKRKEKKKKKKENKE